MKLFLPLIRCLRQLKNLGFGLDGALDHERMGKNIGFEREDLGR